MITSAGTSRRTRPQVITFEKKTTTKSTGHNVCAKIGQELHFHQVDAFSFPCKTLFLVIPGHVSHFWYLQSKINLPSCAENWGCHCTESLWETVIWSSSVHPSYLREEMHRASLCIPVFDVLMNCCSLAKRDRYDSSCLIVLDVSFCKSHLSDVRGLDLKTHMLMILIQGFYLFVETEEEISKPLEQCVTKEVTAQDWWRGGEVSLEGEARAHKMNSRLTHK